jgi:hypothetical protein
MSIFAKLPPEPKSDPDHAMLRLQLTGHNNLCDVYKVLESKDIFFGDKNYKSPETKANFFKYWGSRFCRFVFYIRTGKGSVGRTNEGIITDDWLTKDKMRKIIALMRSRTLELVYLGLLA